MAGLASLTQGISAVISNSASFKKDQQADADICKQISVTSNILAQVDTLTAKLVSLTAMDDETKNSIITLNSTIAAEIASMKKEKKRFSVKILIMIVMNIVLLAVVAISLFS